jgi:hypothetical protein
MPSLIKLDRNKHILFLSNRTKQVGFTGEGDGLNKKINPVYFSDAGAPGPGVTFLQTPSLLLGKPPQNVQTSFRMLLLSTISMKIVQPG